MALLNELDTDKLDSATSLQPVPVSEHLRAIAWLRWRLFVNKLSGTGGEISFAARFIVMPFQALFLLGIMAACGFMAYFSVSEDHLSLLIGTLWGIAVLSQTIPLLTAAAAPPFDFASLIRFPFRYSGYLALRLFYGLLDSHAVTSNCAVFGVFIGMLVADASLALRALPALALFAAVNFLFTRMVLAWIDRWLARRKTREILGVFAVLFSLGIQVAAQLPHYIRHARLSAADHPVLLHTWDVLVKIGATLPPGIAGRSIAQLAHGATASALENLALLVVFAAVFAWLLNSRVYAEYRGENLNEAPARIQVKTKPVHAPAQKSVAPIAAPAVISKASSRFGFSRVTLAVIDKEVRLLLRGSSKIQQLASPLLMAVVFIFRSHGNNGHLDNITWPIIAGYTLFFIAMMLNNCLGAEGAGVNFYFLAPVRMREIIFGKNIVTLGIYVIELGLVYTLVVCFGAVPPLHNLLFTLLWSAFALTVCLTVGNLLSLYSPRKYEVGKVRRQTTSGAASFISIGVMLALAALGFGVHMLAGSLERPYLPYAIFVTLTVPAIIVYIATLNRLDKIAFDRREKISAEICKP